MSKREQLDEYDGALRDVSIYIPKEVDVTLQGFTTYSGISGSDKTYPVLFNFQTSLLLQLIEKVNKIERILGGLQNKTTEDLDSLNKAFGKLKINPDGIKIQKQPEIWKYWMPRKNE